MDYRQRLDNLNQLGFSTYQDYLFSPLWDLIRREILFRDSKECRNPRCPNRTISIEKQIHHLSYNKAVLLGVYPSCLVTFCKDCHHYAEHDEQDQKIPYFGDVVRKSISMLRNNKRIYTEPKHYQRQVGLWLMRAYRDKKNQETARTVLTKLKSSLPSWYTTTVTLAYEGKLGRPMAKYLGITKAEYKLCLANP